MKRNSHNKLTSLSAIALAGLLLFSCTKSDFTIKGNIEGADNTSVILEKADFVGQWIALDSVRTDSKGAFTLKYPATGSPDIFRLRVGNEYAYIPVDSTETVTLTADLATFSSSWKLEGSEKASTLSEFEKDLRTGLPYLNIVDSARSFKHRVFTKYLQNAGGSVVSYYILTKTINDNQPLFNPDNKEDLRIFTAVATSFKEYRPDDPRTPLLESTVLNARRKANSESGTKRVLEAEETGLLPIVLPDEKGNMVSLSSLAGNGKPTLLMFGVMASESAVIANQTVAELMKRRGGDLNVYSVSFDSDAGRWSESAKNIPWTTVLDHNSTSSVAVDYNLSNLPCFYIIDRRGNIKDRTEDPAELERMVARHS